MSSNFVLRRTLPLSQLSGYMERWAQTGLARLESIGQTGGHEILCAVFTDSGVDDENKQVALILAQHSGMEISGMNAVLSLGNYLAAGGPGAREILRKQVVVLVPCPNPYSFSKMSPEYQFRNEAGIDEYTAMDYTGVSEPEKAPAAAALQALIDRWQPELLLDSHGVWYDHQLVLPTLSVSAFTANRFYDSGFGSRIQQAAMDRGYAVFDENWLQRQMPCDAISSKPQYRARFRPGADRGIAPVYAGFHYHTLGSSLEVDREENGLILLVEALRQGCLRQPGEDREGYPVNTIHIGGWCGLNGIRAWGGTAAQRRRSRVELWQHLHCFSFGLVHPEMPGFSGLFVSTSPEKVQRVFGERGVRPFGEALDAMESLPEMDVPALRDRCGDKMEYNCMMQLAQGEAQAYTVRHGITLQLGLTLPGIRIREVTLNGRPLAPEDHNGYTVGRGENWTRVAVHIPPGSETDFAFATVRYDYEERPQGVLEFDPGQDI